MKGLKNKLLASMLSLVMIVSMILPMAVQASLMTSGSIYITTPNNLSVKLNVQMNGTTGESVFGLFAGGKNTSAGDPKTVFDGDTATGVCIRKTLSGWGGVHKVGDYIEVVFKDPIDMKGIVYTYKGELNPTGPYTKATISYTTDGTTWVEAAKSVAPVGNTTSYTSETVIEKVTAVRFINEVAHNNEFLYLAEITVDGTVSEVEDVEPSIFETVELIHPANIENAWYYVFSSPNVQESYGVGTNPALSNLSNGYDDKNVRIASPFDGTVDTVYETVVWQVEKYEDGYSLKAYSSEEEDSYLNITNGDGTEAEISLGKQQALTFDISGDKVKISRTIGNAKYYLRFTGGHGTGFEADVGTNTNDFQMYIVDQHKIPQIPDVEEERETPLYTIAALSDMHVDYGIQNNENTVREITQNALNTIKEKENPDILLAGGDMVSANGGTDKWSQAAYEKVVEQMTAALSAVSKDGKVLYVNGNHDYEAGQTAFNSGAYIDDAMKENVGAYDDVLYEGEDRKSNLLAYYYEIDGIHYIGLNTPYNGDKSISGYVYTKESIDWVEEKLQTIPENDITILLAHYPLQDSRGVSESSKGLSDTYDSNTRLKNMLLGYPNLIYLYGHDHGAPFIEKDTFERVTSYNTDGSIAVDKNTRGNSFTSSFMGSLSYYNNRYNSGWLSASQPKVVQVLMIYVYEDHVDFQMKNYGEETGSRIYPFSYSTDLITTIASDKYDIDYGKKVVSGISHNTTVGELLEELDYSSALEVLDFNGAVITDTSREVRSDMKVRYMNEGKASEMSLRVDKAAESDMPYTIEAVTLQNESGQQVYALRNASAITAITVSANSEEAEASTALIGLYSEDGQLIRSELVPVNGSGTYELLLSLQELPKGTTVRAMVYQSLATMQAASYPFTSDNDRYVTLTVPDSIQTEMVAGVDQKENKVVVFKANEADWNQNSSVAWNWRPTKALGFDNQSSITNISDAKLRYSDYYGGYVAVVTSSGGFVGVVDYETGESLYSRNEKYNGNLHAIELLPDGNVVVAGSDGNSVTIFAASQGDGNGYYKKYTLTSAHGLLWDPDYELLWALGEEELIAYKLTGTQAEPTLEQQTELTVKLPAAGGHDLYPVYGEENKLWLTTVSGLYQFDTDTKEIVSYDNSLINVADIKSVGNQPYSGTMIRIVPNNTYKAWCTNTIELFVPQEDNSWYNVNHISGNDAYYKARVWHYKYQ